MMHCRLQIADCRFAVGARLPRASTSAVAAAGFKRKSEIINRQLAGGC